MANNAFLSFFDKADGESIVKGKEKWVEVQGWDWEVEAESSWTKGGGASVGKPNPGKLNFEHRFDSSSTVILGFICSGKSFPKAELQIAKQGGRAVPETFFTMTMESVFITKASNFGTADGTIIQKVELVFKTVKIEYKVQDNRTGAFGSPKNFAWDISSGIVSP
ncbi:Hcp family type VI secretion system effector [Pollutibacter soli]|uniref:Hcp family type VI secretion system effector n=1 Tax=Pollutibacter soli TaxID=3034157 RepID=UPI003013E04E